MLASPLPIARMSPLAGSPRCAVLFGKQQRVFAEYDDGDTVKEIGSTIASHPAGRVRASPKQNGRLQVR
jgi:hypothetical protein